MSGQFRILIFCCVVILGWYNRSVSFSPTSAHVQVPHAEGVRAVNKQGEMGVLEFSNGSRFQTGIYHLKVLGQLQTVHKLPYYVLSGVGCQECDANVSIYIHSPSDGLMKDEATQPRFSYPGRVIGLEDRGVVSETRMFLGNCVPGHPDPVVWFERLTGDDKQWHEIVFLAEIKDDRLVLEEPKTTVPRLGEAEEAVRKSVCHEVPGITQSAEP